MADQEGISSISGAGGAGGRGKTETRVLRDVDVRGAAAFAEQVLTVRRYIYILHDYMCGCDDIEIAG